MSYTSLDSRRAGAQRPRLDPARAGSAALDVGLFATLITLDLNAGGVLKCAEVAGCLLVFRCARLKFFHGPRKLRLPLLVAIVASVVAAILLIGHKATSTTPPLNVVKHPHHPHHPLVIQSPWTREGSTTLGAGARLVVTYAGESFAATRAGLVEIARPSVKVPIPYKTHATATALAVGAKVLAAILNGHLVLRNRITGRGVQTASLATGPGPILVAPGSVWTTDQSKDKVFVFQIGDLQNPTEIGVPGPVNGFAMDGAEIWASTKEIGGAHPAPGYVGRITPTGDVDRRPLPEGGRLLAYLDGTFWLSIGIPGKAMQILRLTTQQQMVKRPIVIHSTVVGIAALGHLVYVLGRDRRLLAIDPSTDRVVSSTRIHEPNVSGLAAADGRLLVTSSVAGKMVQYVYKADRARRSGGPRRRR
jgi:hypothetical protein